MGNHAPYIDALEGERKTSIANGSTFLSRQYRYTTKKKRKPELVGLVETVGVSVAASVEVYEGLEVGVNEGVIEYEKVGVNVKYWDDDSKNKRRRLPSDKKKV